MANALTGLWQVKGPGREELAGGGARRALLAKLVRRRREQRGISQRELADAVCVSQSLVSLVESPARPLTVGRGRLLDLLRSGLDMTRAEVDACCWLAGRAPLSEGEAGQLFGFPAPPTEDAETTVRSMVAAASALAQRRSPVGHARANWRLAVVGVAGVGLLLAGLAAGLAIGTRNGEARGARASAPAAQQLDLWGWVSYRQDGTPGARTYDMALGSTTPLPTQAPLMDLAACPMTRTLVGIAEQTVQGVVARIVDDAGVVRWTAKSPVATVPGLAWLERCDALAFRSSSGDLLALNALDGSEKSLARIEPGSLVVVPAPLGGTTAWVDGDGLLHVQRDGEPDQVLGAADVAAAQPAWTSDGQRLAWLAPQESGGRSLNVYTLRTGQWRSVGVLDRTAHTLAWAPSGQGIAFAARDGQQNRVLIRTFSGDTLPLFAVAGAPLAGLTWSCGHAPHDAVAENT